MPSLSPSNSTFTIIFEHLITWTPSICTEYSRGGGGGGGDLGSEDHLITAHVLFPVCVKHGVGRIQVFRVVFIPVNAV